MGNFNKEKFVKFVSGKGFYAALAICLIGAGAASWIAVDRTLSTLENAGDSSSVQNSSQPSTIGFFNSSTVQDVGKPDTTVQKPSNTSSEPSSSSSESSDSVNQPTLEETSDVPELQHFMLPVTGELMNEYSNRELVKSVTMGDWRTHDGIDISCDLNTPVLCTSDGKIVDIFEDPLWGTVILTEHPNNYTSVYCGLNEVVNVEIGDNVEIGQILGSVGKSAIIETSLEPHLHFGIKKDGNWVDPLNLITD